MARVSNPSHHAQVDDGSAARRAADEARRAAEAARKAAEAAAAAAAAKKTEGAARRSSGFEHKALGPTPQVETRSDSIARRTSGFDQNALKSAGPVPGGASDAARRASGFDQQALRSSGEVARRASGFDQAAVRASGGTLATTPGAPVAGIGASVPPLTAAEQAQLGTGLPPNGGPQMPWRRDDGFGDPTALAGTMMARSQEQGLLSPQQIERSAAAANRAVPSQDMRQVSALDVGALAREAGIPVERLDVAQLNQAARMINGATSPQEQRNNIALSLNNLSVASNGRMPELSRTDMTEMMWAQAAVPGHALQNLNDSQMRIAFSDVTRAVNRPGNTELRIGNHNLRVSVGNDGSLLRSETKPVGFFTRVGDVLGAGFNWVAGRVFKPLGGAILQFLGSVGVKPGDLGPPYPADPTARIADKTRLDAQFAPAIAALPHYLREVIGKLQSLGVDSVDLFRGSHVIVEDGGRLYEELSQIGGRPRSSSHYSGTSTQQYEILLPLPNTGALLIGRDLDGNTFFQLERTGEKEKGHFGDYISYGLTGLNIGPGGTSSYNDSNPVRVPGGG